MNANKLYLDFWPLLPSVEFSKELTLFFLLQPASLALELLLRWTGEMGGFKLSILWGLHRFQKCSALICGRFSFSFFFDIVKSVADWLWVRSLFIVGNSDRDFSVLISNTVIRFGINIAEETQFFMGVGFIDKSFYVFVWLASFPPEKRILMTCQFFNGLSMFHSLFLFSAREPIQRFELAASLQLWDW